LLGVQPTDRVLEIGFGPGIAVAELSRLAPKGRVMGVDHSDVMVRQARSRNAAGIRAGRVDLRLAAVDELPDFGTPIDKILVVNNMGFWPDPIGRLKELRAMLSPRGKVAVASQPRCPGATRETSAEAGREIEVALRQAGFGRLRTETLELDPPVACVVAETLVEDPGDRRE
jgi:SAM-dependent methyltransferase